MAKLVALLRGVNVGGVKVPMAELRDLASGLGWSDVSTHLNSGNVLFESDLEPDEAGASLEAALSERFARSIPVMVRTPSELQSVAERHPFAASAADVKHVHVAFLAGPAAPGAEERIASLPGPEQCVVEGRDAFLLYPDGLGRSKLTPAVLERALGVAATMRGLRTVQGLVERC